MKRTIGLIALFLMLTSCRTGSGIGPTPGETLPPLTLAEVHRAADSGLGLCRETSPGTWNCEPITRAMVNTQPIPGDAAPFQAQIYLHPEYTTEDYLIKLGIQEKSMWQVRHICGGALIAPNWIATAAHCFPDPELDTSYGVRLGLYNIANDSGHLYHIEEVVRRDPDSPTRDNDLALVRFDPSESSVQTVSQDDMSRFTREAPAITNLMTSLVTKASLVIDSIGQMHIFDADSWTSRAIVGHSGQFRFFDENRKVLSWAGDHVMVTSLDQVDPVRRLPIEQVTGAELLQARNEVLAWSMRTGIVRIWSLETGDLLEDLTFEPWLGTVAGLAGGKGLYVGAGNGAAYIVDRETSERIALSPEVDSDLVGLTAGGDLFFSHNSARQEGRLLKVMTGETVATSTMPSATPDLTLDGKYILSQWADVIMVQDGSDLTEIMRMPIDEMSGYISARLLRDQKHLRVGAYDDAVMDIWSLETRQRVARIRADAGEEINAIEVWPETGLALVFFARDLPANEDGEIETSVRPVLWSLETDAPIAELALPSSASTGPIWHWQVLDGGRRLLHPDRSGRSNIWDIASCRDANQPCPPSRTLDHNLAVVETIVSDDASRLIALSANGTAQFWDIDKSGEINRVFHGGKLTGARFDENNRTAITYGENGFIRFWDIASGTEIRRIDFARNVPDMSVPDMIMIAPENTDALELATYISIDDSSAGPAPGTDVRVLGWGRFGGARGQARSSELREAGLQVISQETCKGPDMWNGAADVHDRVFCATDIERKTCVGDSGGPVIQGTALTDIKLVGIASWGSKDCEADQKPGVYTRISSHADWIREVIGDAQP